MTMGKSDTPNEIENLYVHVITQGSLQKKLPYPPLAILRIHVEWTTW